MQKFIKISENLYETLFINPKNIMSVFIYEQNTNSKPFKVSIYTNILNDLRDSEQYVTYIKEFETKDKRDIFITSSGLYKIL